MNEDVRKQLAALNITWQRYARALEQDLDSIPTEALKSDYLVARDGLAALGVTENKLVYDFARMTFSLPETEISTKDDLLSPVQSDLAVDRQENDDDPGFEQTQLI